MGPKPFEAFNPFKPFLREKVWAQNRLNRLNPQRKGVGPKPFEPVELFEPSVRWNPGGGLSFERGFRRFKRLLTL